jgi:chemotaxis protein histidine kinase CheA
MSDESGLEDLSLVELFRAEVETHAEVLNAALLALERSPGDRSRVDEMMRAAHSIKGAARVVGVHPAASVAHVMEDCFVAAQKGALTLLPGDVDVLLRGVDLLCKISEATRDSRANLALDFDEPVRLLVVELEAMLHPRGAPRGGQVEVAAKPAPSRPGPDVQTAIEVKSPEVATSSVRTSKTLVFPAILDSPAAEAIRRQFLSTVEKGCDLIRIDLRATKDLDVQGLALLAAIPRYSTHQGQPQLRLTGVSAELETVLRVTGLADAYGPCAGRLPEDP